MDSSSTTQPEHYIKEKPTPSAEVAPDLEYATGTDIGGRFRVLEKLGGGGMSVVYRCTDAQGASFAIKFLKAQLATEEKWLNRFKQEAKAIGRLRHPNIIGIQEISFESRPPYIAMEFVQGMSLADVITREGALELPRTLILMNQVADALQHAHSNGVVHRDLKPSNIMLINQGGQEQAKILDFGIAKINEGEDPAGIKMTQTGEIFGSPAYMSPEQSLGKPVDERADQYAFGCVLFECLTGCPPFMGDNAVDTLMRQIHYKPPSLKEASLGRTFSPEVERFVARMLNKEPAQRFASMLEVKRQLAEIAHPPSNFAKAVREAKKADWKLIRIGALFGMLVGLSLGGVMVYTFWLFKPVTTKELGPTASLPATLETDSRVRDDQKLANFVKQQPGASAIDVSGQLIDNKGFAELAKLSFLQRIRANNCQNVTEQAVASIQNLPRLKELSIGDNANITDRVAPYLGRLSLINLSLSRTAVGDPTVAALASKGTIRRIDLTGTYVTDRSVEVLSTLPLDGVSLDSELYVTNKGCEKLGSMKTLHHLFLESNPRLGPCLAKLSHLDLYELSLGHTAVRDSDLKYLLPMKNLRVLDLTFTGITDDGLETLSHLKSLRVLRIKNILSISQPAVAKLQSSLPGCQIQFSTGQDFVQRAGQQAQSAILQALDSKFDMNAK